MRILYVATPRNDYLDTTLVEGLVLLGHEVVGPIGSNGIKQIPADQVVPYGHAADLIVEGSNWAVQRDYIVQLSKTVSKDKFVYVDGCDLPDFEPQGSAFPPDFYHKVFKREMLPNKTYPSNFHSLLFGVTTAYKRHVDFDQKEHFCTSTLGYAVNPTREAFTHQVVRYNDRDTIAYWPSNLPINEYRDLLSKSKISISMKGWGFDCARYWECVGADTVVASTKVDVIFENPYVDGVTYIEWNSFEQLIDKLKYYRVHQDKLEEMTKASIAHTTQYHTTVKRAEKFLKELFL